jgi:hypothetical protein
MLWRATEKYSAVAAKRKKGMMLMLAVDDDDDVDYDNDQQSVLTSMMVLHLLMALKTLSDAV